MHQNTYAVDACTSYFRKQDRCAVAVIKLIGFTPMVLMTSCRIGKTSHLAELEAVRYACFAAEHESIIASDIFQDLNGHPHVHEKNDEWEEVYEDVDRLREKKNLRIMYPNTHHERKAHDLAHRIAKRAILNRPGKVFIKLGNLR